MSGIQEFLDAAEKAAPVVLAQLTLSPNLLLFQLRAEAEPASSARRRQDRKDHLSHPSCLE